MFQNHSSHTLTAWLMRFLWPNVSVSAMLSDFSRVDQLISRHTLMIALCRARTQWRWEWDRMQLCSEWILSLAKRATVSKVSEISLVAKSCNSILLFSFSVSVQCNQQDMLLTLNFDSPFNGRVYAKGNPSQCFVVGSGQNQLQFAIALGSRCGTRQEVCLSYLNCYRVINKWIFIF